MRCRRSESQLLGGDSVFKPIQSLIRHRKQEEGRAGAGSSAGPPFVVSKASEASAVPGLCGLLNPGEARS
jgi:hypothetical protein